MSSFRRPFRLLCIALTPFVLVASLLVALAPTGIGASSHREAPLISSDPDADGTDFYMFVSPDRQDSVTLIANYIPFEAPEGAPNFNQFSPNVLYEINIDTVGDGKAHVKYQFQFTNLGRQDSASPTFLYNNGPITSLNDVNWQQRQTYKVTEVKTYGTSVTTTTLAAAIPTPPSNIGSKSTPNYTALVNEALNAGLIGTGTNQIKVFAGQRDDPFWVDLGSIFDLLSLRGQAPPVGYATGPTVGIDNLTGFNVHTLAIQVPISRIFSGGGPAGETVIGGWTTASRRTTRTLTGVGGVLSGGGAETHSGPYVQVSRLGMPLTNEAVLPVALKDAFNNLTPDQDVTIYTATTPPLNGIGDLLQKSVENPELGVLLCALYGVPLPRDANDDCQTEVNLNTPASGRIDIFKIFLTGMTLTKPFTIQTATGAVALPAGFVVNQPTKGTNGSGAGIVPAEMLRLNTAIKGTTCSATPSRLGILGGDACGFPNGRRLGDDVVEIELLAVAGAAYSVLAPDSFTFTPALVNVLTDGSDRNDVPFLGTFPYAATPHQGQEHIHTNLNRMFFPSAALNAVRSRIN
jgi:hypothetical protein